MREVLQVRGEKIEGRCRDRNNLKRAGRTSLSPRKKVYDPWVKAEEYTRALYPGEKINY